MKLCQTCGQSVAEEINICPACGGEVGEGREYIDDYRIAEVLHEGHASILCRAVKDGEEKPVMIRLFVSESGVDQEVADRLKRELEELKKLPADSFVSHQEIRRSSDGLWYRVSEWIDAESWGDLVRSGRLRDYRFAFDLFSKIASILDILHQAGHFIPHLILNDIMLLKREGEGLEVKIDYKLSRFLDPKLDRPGPMLKRLLECHPDIINERPLDYRSDIWSLGKIFVELLTADYETCDFLGKIDELPLPHDADVLFRTMLAEDPELRPRSMREVAETLNRITQADIEAAKSSKWKWPLPRPEPFDESRGDRRGWQQPSSSCLWSSAQSGSSQIPGRSATWLFLRATRISMRARLHSWQWSIVSGKARMSSTEIDPRALHFWWTTRGTC